MLKRINWKVVKPIGFILAFCVLFSCASRVLVSSGGNYQMMGTFPDEPAGSLDAVYIGPSTSFTLFQGPIAWKKYGMTVRMFSSDGQAMASREYFVRYARKKHPDALYIITINTYGISSFSKESIHWAADSFPNSPEKYQMISKMTSLSGYTLEQKIPVFLPFFQYHTRWNVLSMADFKHESNGLKGAFASSTFLNVAQDVTESYVGYTTERAELDDETIAYYDNLLDYCDEVKLNALFLFPPSCRDEETIKLSNSIQQLLESRGYPVLNLLPRFEEMGMDLETDYYNAGHTNVHGSLKVTDYIAEYLHETYSFEDKRGNPDYASWDDAYDSYKAIIAPYLSEDELGRLP